MRLRVLVDNNTYIDKYFYGEPGLSYLIEEGSNKILFDLGYSDIFILNAEKMGVDISEADTIVFSHGHSDHTWGMEYLIRHCMKAKGHNSKPKRIVAHPQAFDKKTYNGELIGSKISVEKLAESFELILSSQPVWLTEKLLFLGEIPRENTFENKKPIGKTVLNGCETDDYLFDDTALVFRAEEGLVVITACSHSGICNIVEYAKKVCDEDRILDIIGGFHLLEPTEEQMKGTLDYFRTLKLRYLYACHCTDLDSKIQLSKVAKLMEVGVGLKLEYK
ncbi:MAG: MBL fold metallo-hydrolase [Clostridiaceae bacterium]|nr:MBL fold metallo-hydrolase [Clostridiaceae bacterium]